jgi:hypothetical protein
MRSPRRNSVSCSRSDAAACRTSDALAACITIPRKQPRQPARTFTSRGQQAGHGRTCAASTLAAFRAPRASSLVTAALRERGLMPARAARATSGPAARRGMRAHRMGSACESRGMRIQHSEVRTPGHTAAVAEKRCEVRLGGKPYAVLRVHCRTPCNQPHSMPPWHLPWVWA